MREIASTALRARLGVTLMQVLDGDTFRVTRNGQTIAYLVAPRDWDDLNGVMSEQLALALALDQPTVDWWIRVLVNEWGRRRVIARESEQTGKQVLVTAAAEEIMARVVARRKESTRG